MLPVPDVALADRRVVLRVWCVDPPCRVSAVGSRESRHWSDSRGNGSCGDTSGRSRPLLGENAGVFIFVLRIYKEHISDHLIFKLRI